ncbi:MAG: TPM domain-containing protein [bacterium]|nr:TPM domain-containing protein [bacterium]
MRRLKFHKIPLLILLLVPGPWSVVCSPSSAFASPLPSPQGYVNDFAGILKSETKQSLADMAQRLDQSATVELAIVTIPSLEGDTVEDYAVKLFEKWGIGKKSKDNGLLFLIAPNERKARIEVGYGLEGELNDAKAARLLRDIFVPYAKEGNLNEGIIQTTGALYKIFTQGITVEEAVSQGNSFPHWLGILFLLVTIYLFIRHPFLFLLFMGSGSGSSRNSIGGFGGGGGFGGFGGGGSGGGGGSASW